jgi:hypothetical protein
VSPPAVVAVVVLPSVGLDQPCPSAFSAGQASAKTQVHFSEHQEAAAFPASLLLSASNDT